MIKWQGDRSQTTGPHPKDEGNQMKWSKPTYRELRLGFEVTMYVFNR